MRKIIVLVHEPTDLATIDVPGSRNRNVLVAEDPDARPHAVVSFWADPITDVPDWPGTWAYEVEEHDRWTDAEPTLRRWVLICRNPALDGEGFAARYANHAELARVHHPSICDYTQDVVRQALHGAPWFDGMSELGFWDRDRMLHGHYDSPEGKALMNADIAEFLDPSRSVAVLGK